MKKQNNNETRCIFSAIIAIAIFDFCAVACLFKLCFHQAWIGPSVVSLIFTIMGGTLISYFELRYNGNGKTAQEENEYIKNAFFICLLGSIATTVITLFITAVVFNVYTNYCEYFIIVFVSFWVGIIATIFISYAISKL